MAINLFQLSCFTAFALVMNIIPLTTTAITTTKPQRFVSKLIHHDAIGSSAIESSAARFAYLQARALAGADDIRAGVIADNKFGGVFMANISIGDPPVPQLLIMDTGSNLIWTQCLPCTHPCLPQTLPVFDPSKSSTYATKSCISFSCPGYGCDSLLRCKFSKHYLDGTAVAGVIATEKFTFETSDEGTTFVSDIVFGCANDVQARLVGQHSGIVGLGNANDKVSLPAQLGSKFSYCLGSIRDPLYPHNQLILGDGAKIEGPSTQVEFFNGLYFLTLDGISVGDKRLDIDPQIFRRTASGNGGVVIDSGATLTYLARGGFEPLRAEVQRLADGMLQPVDRPGLKVPCYNGVIERDLVGFPWVVFHFAGGVDLGLDTESMFMEITSNQFCMAVMPSERQELSIIGVLAQQKYNIGYDLAAKKISFQRIDCELLET